MDEANVFLAYTTDFTTGEGAETKAILLNTVNMETAKQICLSFYGHDDFVLVDNMADDKISTVVNEWRNVLGPALIKVLDNPGSVFTFSFRVNKL